MKIYTKTGDDGHTSLLNGHRISKYSLRVETYGTLDELNSMIGFAISVSEDQDAAALMKQIQPLIHTLCSDIAAPYDNTLTDNVPRISVDDIGYLEGEIDRMTAELPQLKNFILPGGNIAGSSLHLARTVCRRAERGLVELAELEGLVNPHALIFVNRLSDYLFTIARWTNHRSGINEDIWQI